MRITLLGILLLAISPAFAIGPVKPKTQASKQTTSTQLSTPSVSEQSIAPKWGPTPRKKVKAAPSLRAEWMD